MKKKTKDYILFVDETTIEIIVLLHCFFDDFNKIRAWLQSENPNLGGISPVIMINRGRGKRVLAFVESSLND